MTSWPANDLQRLLAEEPYVRSLARALMTDGADDVAQQTWLQALQHGGGDVTEPRPWLARVVRNAAANLRRGELRRRARERVAAVGEAVPSSAELMQREERRRALVQAVDGLPTALRAVVLLRWFEGLPPRRIAARLGLPVTTVWSQLRRALQSLRQRLDAGCSDRRAWLLPLAGLGVRTARPLPAGPLPIGPLPTGLLLLNGVIAMTMKTKLAGLAAVALALASAYLLWRDVPAPAPGVVALRDAPPPAAAQAGLEATADGAAAPTAAPQREPVAAPTSEATGALVMHVRWGDDHAAAAGVTMILRRIGREPRLEGVRRTTDAAGEVRFAALPPGACYALSDRSGLRRAPTRIQIEAGKTVEVEHELEIGLTVTGVVVDATGVPVGNALVEVGMPGRADADLEPLATTGADGRFAIRGAPTFCVLGARAAGHASSPLREVNGKDGNAAEVRLELGKDGGVVDGIVVGPDGSPVANAVVIVGSGRTSGVVTGRDGGPPIPALVRTDDAGQFHAVGVPAGDQPVQVRAFGLAPWAGQCLVPAGSSAWLRADLTPGATVRGIVRDATGAPVKDAEVEVGDWDVLAHYVVRTAADGAFAIAGLPAGELEIRAQSDRAGRVSTRVRTEAGRAVPCDLQLSRGLELRGRVLDESGAPVSKAMVECIANRSSAGKTWFTFERTDAEGRFTAANCPEEGGISVTVRAKGIEELRRTDVDPKQSPLELRVRTAQQPTARITGVVVAPDGTAVPNASVNAYRRDRREQSGIQATGPDGRFELGPVAPGEWDITVRATGYPDRSETRVLAAAVSCDLGEIRLAAGGTAAVTVIGDAEGIVLQVVDADERHTFAVEQAGTVWRTDALAAGEYRLIAFGSTAAAQAVPFTIRAGAETPVEVRLQAGVRQRVEVALPAGSGADVHAYLRVLRGNQLVARAWPQQREHALGMAEVWLAPGSYSLHAGAGTLTGRIEFTVGSAEAAPLRIELR